MQQHNFFQGSPEWLAYRATARNASDAPAVLGCSDYVTRSELLHTRHTGIRPEVLPDQQRRFDDGHAIEAAQRPGAEEVIGEDLFPVVGSEVVDGIELSASFDGLTMLEDTAYEAKTLNDKLRAALPHPGPDGNDAANLPKAYRVQMEQQLMVASAERVLFVAANKDGSEVRRCWYYPDQALRAEILAGWKQFDADLAAYVPTEVVQPAVAAPVESLPAVAVQVQGALAVVTNLDKFGLALRGFIAKIPAKPTTDQEFADCEAACKALKRAEEALDAAETGALAQVSSVEELTRTVADLRKLARETRLASEKVVKHRKDQIRQEEVARGRNELERHVADLNVRIGRPYMPLIAADFAGCISGLKKLDSLRDAIDTELARAKIEANRIADLIQVNLRHLADNASEYRALFPDTSTIVLKAPEDLQALVSARIAEHKAAEAKRLEAERERIRAEEAARLEREQAAREAEARQQQSAAEEAERQQQPAAAPAPNVVPMPTKTPAQPATLNLGAINTRLGFTVSADFIKRLGVEPALIEGRAQKFTEHQFSLICEALVAHVRTVQDQQRKVA